MILQVLCPVIYELVPPEMSEKLTFIPYPDPGSNSDSVWEVKKDNGLWRSSKCLGINFSDIFKDNGLNIDDFYRECTYTISEGAIVAAIYDIKNNYPEITIIGGDDISKKKAFISPDSKNIYEFVEKDGNRMVLIIDPEPESIEASVLPCLQLPEVEVEVPNQAAIDYYTKSGIYVFTEEGFSEIASGLPELKSTIDQLNPDYHIIRWDGVLRDTPERKRPWRDKLESLRNKILNVDKEHICNFLKSKKIKKLIKKYYGDI